MWTNKRYSKMSVIIRQTFGVMRQREFLRRAASVSAEYVCVSYCHVIILSIIRESIFTVWTRYRSHPKVSGRAQRAHHHYHFDRPVTCSDSNESIRAKCFQVIGGTFASPFPNFFDKASRTVNVVPIMTKFTFL
jgi:hypothetical protein